MVSLLTNLLEWITELPEDAVLIKHLALEPMLIIVVDPLSDISWQFMERHVLLHLLILKTRYYCYSRRHSRHSTLLLSDVTFCSMCGCFPVTVIMYY